MKNLHGCLSVLWGIFAAVIMLILGYPGLAGMVFVIWLVVLVIGVVVRK